MAPNGDIHFVPGNIQVGQKINKDGVVSTYSLIVSAVYSSGILVPNGDIYFIPYGSNVGEKISTQSALPFSLGTCCSPYFNKF